MRICRFEIKRFKGIQTAAFDWDDITMLIGENNSGKSTVLQALQCFLGGAQLKDEAFFCENYSDFERAIELVAHFSDLSEVETQAGAVRGRMIGDRWILKKKFWCERQGDEELVWREAYYSYSQEEAFLNWPVNDATWANFPPEYQTLIDQMEGRELDRMPSRRSDFDS